MKNYQTQRVMLYFQIKQLLQEKFTISQISEKLSISRTTVYSYANMGEEDFMAWVKQSIPEDCTHLKAWYARAKAELGE